MTKDIIFEHLQNLQKDIREEIKIRIQERNKYSIQLTLALGAIYAFGLSLDGFVEILISAPIVSLYFTSLILYSYKIHDCCTQYLREQIEPQISKYVNVSRATEWEIFYKENLSQKPGIRRGFFLISLWIVTITTMFYLFYASTQTIVVVVASLVFILSCIAVTYYSGEI